MRRLLKRLRYLLARQSGLRLEPRTSDPGSSSRNDRTGVSRIYVPSANGGALRQGEILTGVVQAVVGLGTRLADVSELRVNLKAHPYAVVVTQDCDLDWDFKTRQETPDEPESSSPKTVPNILLCEVDTAERLRKDFNTKTWNQVKTNKNERYHFLQKIGPEEDLHAQGLPELAVDFKRYFTLPTGELYYRIQSGEARRRCRLGTPYVEHFAQRFHFFQSRIALPAEHESEPSG